MSYNVALRSKPCTRQPGVLIWTSFSSEDDFLGKMEEYLENYDIVAVGLSTDEANALTETHPFYYFYAALAQSFQPDGVFSLEMFEMKIKVLVFETGELYPKILMDIASQLIKGLLDEVPPIESFFPR